MKCWILECSSNSAQFALLLKTVNVQHNYWLSNIPLPWQTAEPEQASASNELPNGKTGRDDDVQAPPLETHRQTGL